MPQETWTTAEIQEVATAVLSPYVINEGKPNMLDEHFYPEMNLLFAMSKLPNGEQPTNNAVRALVEAPRRQRIQWFAGADMLTFQGNFGTYFLDYELGQAHLGDEILYDVVRHAGHKVSYSDGITGKHSVSSTKVLYNIIERNKDRYMRAYKRDLCKSLFRSNAADPKAFLSFVDLFSPATNSTGTIGKKSRSNVLNRHQLVTGVTRDTIQKQIHQLYRLCTRRSMKGQPKIVLIGDTIYEMLLDVFTPNPGITTPADRRGSQLDMRLARELAMKEGEKFNVALPQDCFMYQDMLFVNPPLWAEIDEDEAPAVPLAKQLHMINPEHTGFERIRHEEHIVHKRPENQLLQRQSLHGEYVVWNDQPGTYGVLVAA